jgi:hypothetical protein
MLGHKGEGTENDVNRGKVYALVEVLQKQDEI